VAAKINIDIIAKTFLKKNTEICTGCSRGFGLGKYAFLKKIFETKVKAYKVIYLMMLTSQKSDHKNQIKVTLICFNEILFLILESNKICFYI